jgi:cyclophilin family peptidyl-prolyl cis-trans isomerase
MVGKKSVLVWVFIILIITNSLFIANTSGETKLISNDPKNPYDDSNETSDDCKNKPNRIAIIDTTYGEIKFELFEKRAPITSSNFINLSIDAFYDGILFHRVIDDFVIQTGDPNTKDNNPYNDGSGGSSKTIPLEIHPELTHVDGAVGMARSSDPDSASSQFYICDGPQHGLDGDYAVFGVVIDGLDVVRKIAQVETWGYKRPVLKDHPIDDVIMYSVFITENNSEYKHQPPADEDSWLAGDGFEVPGFESTMLITAVIVFLLIIKKRYQR